jgi:hypothetical protein
LLNALLLLTLGHHARRAAAAAGTINHPRQQSITSQTPQPTAALHHLC